MDTGHLGKLTMGTFKLNEYEILACLLKGMWGTLPPPPASAIPASMVPLIRVKNLKSIQRHSAGKPSTLVIGYGQTVQTLFLSGSSSGSSLFAF